MKLLNRIMVLIIGALLVIVITLIILAPDTLANVLGTINGTSPILRLIAVVVIDVIIALLVYAVIRNDRHVTSGLVVKASGLLSDISVESTRDRVVQSIAALQGIQDVTGEVKALNGRADIELNIKLVNNAINIPEKHAEIDRTIKQVVTKQLGLQLAGRPRVHIELASQGTKPVEPLKEPIIVTTPDEPEIEIEPVVVEPPSSTPVITPPEDDENLFK